MTTRPLRLHAGPIVCDTLLALQISGSPSAALMVLAASILRSGVARAVEGH